MSAGEYFGHMAQALRQANIYQPTLVLDVDRLDRNIDLVKARMPATVNLRLVDKSLPSVPLLKRIVDRFSTRRIMTFHPPVSRVVLETFADVELLLGKPMPVDLARQMLTQWAESETDRIVWLIDTPQRLAEYGALASSLNRALRFCFEVDVGLHRGGFRSAGALANAMAGLAKMPRLQCKGIMAYEAHIGHIPKLFGGPALAQRNSVRLFRQFVALLRDDQRDILNLGGSTTALTYDADAGANELSLGSAFLKPSDFEVQSLDQLAPAAYIATPVLKVGEAQLPGPQMIGRLLRSVGFTPRRGCFVYGGKWMAKPVWPGGMTSNSTFGHSTNQQFFALSDAAIVKVDDYAFLRPTQSEFVLQQFGSIAVMSGGEIIERWAALPMQ